MSDTPRADAAVTQWAFADHPDSEHWCGPYATKREAIAQALGHYGDTEDGFTPCLSQCRPVQPSDHAGDEDWTFICIGPREIIEFS